MRRDQFGFVGAHPRGRALFCRPVPRRRTARRGRIPLPTRWEIWGGATKTTNGTVGGPFIGQTAPTTAVIGSTVAETASGRLSIRRETKPGSVESRPKTVGITPDVCRRGIRAPCNVREYRPCNREIRTGSRGNPPDRKRASSVAWQIPIYADPGSVILWDSRTVHSATLPRPLDYGEDPLLFDGGRAVIYVSYRPEGDVPPRTMKTRRRAVRENRGTNHWSGQMMPKIPGNWRDVSSRCSPAVRALADRPATVYERLGIDPLSFDPIVF